MAHPIIAVATLKGGSGKSTVASCLAVRWHLAGRRVVIIDADPQRSLARLATRERGLGGAPLIEDASADVWRTARERSAEATVVIDTPGFHAPSTVGALAAASVVIVPVKPSPLDVDRMLDTLSLLLKGVDGWRPAFRCLLTQTVRDSLIAKQIRAEIIEAGFPMFRGELANRVAFPEAALYGATPDLIGSDRRACGDIAEVAAEVDDLLIEAAAA